MKKAVPTCKKGRNWFIDKDLSQESMMNARPKKKLCWNCEGSVSLSAESCPYCGVSVAGLPPEMSTDLPTPPYRLVNATQESAIPVAPYLDETELEEEESAEELSEDIAELADKAGEEDTKKTVGILALLFAGSVFLLFGFALFLFSDEGYLTLHWNASYWFVYLLLALPLLFFGLRSLNTLQEQ
jgi:hypothetical protein